MKKRNQRLCIYPKDIQLITGKSYRQSVRLLDKVKKFYEKKTFHLVTITEFCLYYGLDIDAVYEDISFQ